MTSSSSNLGKPSSVTQRGKTEPFELQISRQDIAGHFPFEIFGFSTVLSNVAAGPLWEGLTASGGLYAYPGSASALTLASSSVSDLMVVQVNGLDANFNMLSETVKMNGTSNVTTVNSYLRINSLICLGANNVGTITAKITGTVYAQINPTIGQTQMSLFTVPNGYTLFVYSAQGQTNIHYSTTTDYTMAEYNKQNIPANLFINGYNTNYQAGSTTTLQQTPIIQTFTTTYITPSPRPAGTDIQWTMLASVAGPQVGAILVSGYLVQNSMI